MSVNTYKKKLEFKKKLISRQSEQIEKQKLEIEKLEQKNLELQEMLNSVSYLREELEKNVNDTKKYKKQYQALIKEIKNMKNIMNQEVFKNRWWLIKFLIK